LLLLFVLFTTRKRVTALLCEMQNLFTPSELYRFPPALDGFENSWLFRFSETRISESNFK